MDDFEELKLPAIAKISGGIALLLGFFHCILAAQTYVVLRSSVSLLVVGVMLSLGLSAGYSGYRITRGSGKAAITATLVAAGTVLTTGVWLLFALRHGMLSPLTLLVLLFALATVIFSGLAVPDLRRVDAARERLRAQGLDTGL